MSRHVRISIRTARDRYPAVVSLLSGLQSTHDEIVVKKGGVLPRGVGRSTPRRSGKVYISYQLVQDGVLVLVPEGKQVRKVARRTDCSHVVEVQTTSAARRFTHSGVRKVVRAATVVIYEAPAT